MKDVKGMTMSEMVLEYNSATGKAIKKFSSRQVGEAKVNALRGLRPSKDKVEVGGTVYRSVKQAFEVLGLNLKKHQKFRRELKLNGESLFDNKYFFKIVRKTVTPS